MEKAGRIISALMIAVMLISCAPFYGFAGLRLDIKASAADLIDSGTCGDDLTWTLGGDGTLTIGGTGTMWNFYMGEAPWYDHAVQNVVIQKGVTSIGEAAFYNSAYLIGITIPDSVTSVGNYSFVDCKNLKSIVIPNSVTSIGDAAFDGCKQLTSVTISNKVFYIGFMTFADCEKLTDIKIPDSVTSIDTRAFFNCKSMTNVCIPKTVTFIGEEAFGYREAGGGGFLREPLSSEKIPGFTVTGTPGTAAETYAGENGFKFIPLHSHVYTAKVTKNATCTAAGVKTFTCSCGKSYQEAVPALGHSYSTAWTVDKAATCTAQGSKSHHCTRCGAKKNVTAIPMVAHKNKVTLTKATTAKDGKQVTTCSVCKKTLKTVVIPKASSFKLSASSYAYDGKGKTPSVTVKDSKGKTLKNGTDYTLTYSKKGAKAIGKYTVKVTLKGNYSGTKTLTYYIKPGVTSKLSVKQTTNSVALTWKKVNGATGYRVMVYNAKTKKWDKVADTNKLTYTVKKLKAGTAYRYAVKAYYKKGSTLIWADKLREVSTATKPATPTLTVKAGAKKATLSWKKLTGSGYEVYMATSKNGKYKKLATIKNAKTVSYTAKNLKKGQTVYFKIRAYKTVGKTNVYSAYSAVKAVKVK